MVMIAEVRVLQCNLVSRQSIVDKEMIGTYLPVGGLPSGLVDLSAFLGAAAFSRKDRLALLVDLAARCLEKLSL